jgi:hypothetical protein
VTDAEDAKTSPTDASAGGDTDAVLRRLVAGACYLSSDNRTSMNGCDQFLFWHADRGYHVFWNREHGRPQLLHAHDEAGFATHVRIGFPSWVPEGVAKARAALPEAVVAGSAAHLAARERIVADLRRDRTTWLALPRYEAWGEHLWPSPSGVWLLLGSKASSIVGIDDAVALERIDGSLMLKPECGAVPADAALVAAALDVDAAVQRAEAALADGLMLVVDPHAGWGTRVFVREGERLYHLAINAGRGLSGSLRPVHRGELFEGVQKAGGALEPTPPAAREDVRAFLQEPPFAPRR